MPVDGLLLPRFQPGAHVETFLDTSHGVLSRHYSICSPTDDLSRYQIAVKRTKNSRGGSSHWHDEVSIGTTLLISPPRNHLGLHRHGRHHLFVAGGIGITPFIPMLAELQSRGESYELHYAATSPASCAFHAWLKENFADTSHFYFSSLQTRVTTRILENRRIGTHLYLCGPVDMMKEFQTAAWSFGYPKANIHTEVFAPGQDFKNQVFRVQLQHKGIELEVPENRTLLQTLLDAGVHVPHSCQVGGCGTCQIEVLEGELDHRDFYLDEDERASRQTVISCVSRARGQALRLNL